MPLHKPAPAISPTPLAFTASDPLLASFPPVVARDTHTLILGSLPGAASLAKRQYYGHPRNAFWRLVGDALGVDLMGMDYADRLPLLLAHGIGLWDVIATARRLGSLDSAIRDHVHNDLLDLLEKLPHLHTIGFNGGTAAKIGMKALGERAGDYRIVMLPSSSPAYAAMTFSEKLVGWREGIQPATRIG